MKVMINFSMIEDDFSVPGGRFFFSRGLLWWELLSYLTRLLYTVLNAQSNSRITLWRWSDNHSSWDDWEWLRFIFIRILPCRLERPGDIYSVQLLYYNPIKILHLCAVSERQSFIPSCVHLAAVQIMAQNSSTSWSPNFRGWRRTFWKSGGGFQAHPKPRSSVALRCVTGKLLGPDLPNARASKVLVLPPQSLALPSFSCTFGTQKCVTTAPAIMAPLNTIKTVP